MEEVNSCEELKTAVPKANEEAEKRYLIKRAIDLGCVDHIPEDWTLEVKTDG